MIDNDNARCICKLIFIVLAGYLQYPFAKAKAEQKQNDPNQQDKTQGIHMAGTKTRARGADNDNDNEMVQAGSHRQSSTPNSGSQDVTTSR